MKRSVKMMVIMAVMSMWTALFAQATHTIDFNPTGRDWHWVVENNDTNPPLNIQNRAGAGPPRWCAAYTALSTGMNWASVATLSNGEFTFSSTNSTVRIDVDKPVASKVVIRFEGSSAPAEVEVANTVTNAWQTLTFDFSPYIGNTYDKMIIIPDFVEPYVTGTDRPSDRICWIDNIQVPQGVVAPPPSGPETAAPTPTNNQSDVISIWSDAFTDISDVDPLVWWHESQTTEPSIVDIEGIPTILYENLNFQGVDWNTNPQNVEGMEYLHVDIWTGNSTQLEIFLISGIWQVDQAEYPYNMNFWPGEWTSFDIPLSHFSNGGVNLTDTRQFKFEGNGDIYIDNLYFWKEGTASGEDARLSDLRIDGMTMFAFNSNVYNYSYEVPVWESGVPTVTATLSDPAASYQIFDSPVVPGTTEVQVTAANGTTTQSYYVNFTSKGYTLIWSDEFNSGTQPDPTYWSYDLGYGPDPGSPGWGNDEWQLYTDNIDNVRIEDGNLVISAQCPSGNPGIRDGSVTSARIKTEHKFDFRYGLMQARIKAPTGMGMWAAFWALGANFDTVGWPYCGELDVMEIAQHSFGTNTSLSAMHWSEDTAGGAHWYVSFMKDMGVDLSNDYHIYELDWEYDRVIGKIDGMPFFERQIGHIGMTEFVQRFFLLLNVAVGGTLGGAPDATTVWPQNMYVDWVRVYQLDNPTAPVVQAPIPTQEPADVRSIFSDAYTNIAGVTLNPWWEGQETFIYMNYPIEPNDNLIFYEGLNFAGIDWSGNRQDVSGLDYLHVDFFTANSTALSIFLISNNTQGDTQQKEYVFNITPHQWNSVNIPLSHFLPEVNLSRTIQLMFTGNGEVWVDNIYFFEDNVDPATDATLSDLRVDGTTVSGFNSLFYNYEHKVPFGTTEVPAVTATTSNTSASYVVNDPAGLPGTTEVAVTAQDGVTTQSYFVDFVFKPEVGAPAPTHDPGDVISVYSDVYTDITPVDYNPSWGQTTVVIVDYDIAGDNTLYYQNLNYQGTDWYSIPQDVSGMDYLHVDFWTTASDSLGIFLIDENFTEKKFHFTVLTDQWVSVDIPLSYFEPEVDLTSAVQFKVEGTGDVWLDNLYFFTASSNPPIMSVSVTDLDGEAEVGQTDTGSFTITNDGDEGASDLIYSFSFIYDGNAGEDIGYEEGLTVHENDFNPFPGNNYTNSGWNEFDGGARAYAATNNTYTTHTLTSPQFDTDGFTNLEISWWQEMDLRGASGNSYCRVEYNNGSGWTTVYNTANTIDNGNKNAVIPVTGPTGQIRFTGYLYAVTGGAPGGRYNEYWLIDNIVVSGDGESVVVIPHSWMSATPMSGTVSPGDFDTIYWTMDSTDPDLDLGTYTGTFRITSNAEEPRDIPMTFVVGGDPIEDLDAPVVSVAMVGGNARLSWGAVDGASSYVIYSSADPYGTFEQLETTSNTQWDYTHVGTESKMFFYVVATDGAKAAPMTIEVGKPAASTK